MAQITDQQGHVHNVASNSKGNAALTTGIIGTSLGGLLALGGMAGLSRMIGNTPGTTGGENCPISGEENYIERKQAQNYLDITKQYYEGRLTNQRELTDAFFAAYERDVNNSWMLSKQAHDNFDVLNQKIIDTSFNLYKNQRDEKDALMAKIGALESKVDVMAAVRPYQDALINAKIDKNAIISDFNLARRTCRMIEGQLVLPNTPEVTGYSSYYNSCFTPVTE